MFRQRPTVAPPPPRSRRATPEPTLGSGASGSASGEVGAAPPVAAGSVRTFHAAIYLVAAAIAVRTLPLRAVRRGAAVLGRRVRLPRGPETVARMRAAVDAASGLAPGGGNCLVRALALRTLLAHRGIVSELRVGFLRGDRGVIEGHAWLELDGTVIVGEVDGIEEFRGTGTAY